MSDANSEMRRKKTEHFHRRLNWSGWEWKRRKYKSVFVFGFCRCRLTVTVVGRHSDAFLCFVCTPENVIKILLFSMPLILLPSTLHCNQIKIHFDAQILLLFLLKLLGRWQSNNLCDQFSFVSALHLKWRKIFFSTFLIPRRVFASLEDCKWSKLKFLQGKWKIKKKKLIFFSVQRQWPDVESNDRPNHNVILSAYFWIKSFVFDSEKKKNRNFHLFSITQMLTFQRRTI